MESIGESYIDHHRGKFIMTNSMLSYILNALYMFFFFKQNVLFMINDESHGGNCDETNFQEQFQVYNYESHDDFLHCTKQKVFS